MRKIIPALILISFFALPVIALAQEEIPDTITSLQGVLDIIDTITSWVFTIFLAVSILFIIFAAIQFLTSGGDPTKVSSARASLMYALIGIAVAFLSKGLIVLVQVILGITPT